MDRPSHPCLASDCRHPETEHVATPELAGPEEVVVWCVACRRHETRGTRRWFHSRSRTRSATYRGLAPRVF